VVLVVEGVVVAVEQEEGGGEGDLFEEGEGDEGGERDDVGVEAPGVTVEATSAAVAVAAAASVVAPCLLPSPLASSSALATRFFWSGRRRKRREGGREGGVEHDRGFCGSGEGVWHNDAVEEVDPLFFFLEGLACFS